MMLRVDQLQQIFPQSRQQAALFFDPLARAMGVFQINTPPRIAAFLAQIGHESGELRVLEENLNYRADRLLAVFPKYFSEKTAPAYARNPQSIASLVYANRMGNGSVASGDGWKYRGRGLIQITGHDNYAACGKAVGADLVADPDLLLQPHWAALSAAWFWATHGCNALADAGKFDAITQRINGGQTGAIQRRALWLKIKTVMVVQ